MKAVASTIFNLISLYYTEKQNPPQPNRTRPDTSAPQLNLAAKIIAF
ncbi:hypothetical protein [Levilactobacillus parabrevis]|nr:hypothetical protein [Levilactobacillus parabrevis]